MNERHSPSADDALNESLLTSELDEADLAAIEEGLAQLDRGEGRPWEQVRAELQAKYLSR